MLKKNNNTKIIVLILFFSIILMPILLNWVISWNSKFTVSIINKTQEIWIVVFATLFSSILGSIIGGWVAYNISLSQLESNYDLQEKILKKNDKRQLALKTFVDIKEYFNLLTATTTEIMNFLVITFMEMHNDSYVMNKDEIEKMRSQFQNVIKQCNVLLNNNMFLLSEFENKDSELSIDWINKSFTKTILQWNKFLGSCLSGSNVKIDEMFEEVNTTLIPLMNDLRNKSVKYEYEYLKHYLGDIVLAKEYSLNPMKELNIKNVSEIYSELD
jgi:hypothetical protein